jgi:hypothetical protein
LFDLTKSGEAEMVLRRLIFTRRIAGTLGLAMMLAASLLATTPAQATDCAVNAFDAYAQAVKKGWAFRCINGPVGQKSNPVFLPLVPDGIGCVGKVPGFPNMNSGEVRAHFFHHQSQSLFGGDTKYRKLNNGWTLFDYDVVGGQYTRYYDNDRTLINYRMEMNPGVSYKYVTKKLMLRKEGGSCANVIEEAF